MGTETGVRAGIGPLPGMEPNDELRLVRALAAGRSGDVGAVLGRLDDEHPLLADIIRADVAAHVAGVDLAELHILLDRATDEAADLPLLRWWVLAILGERAFLDTDLSAIPLVLAVLDEVPDDPFVGAALLYVRGRLRRIASASFLVSPSVESLSGHRAASDLAVADFLRGGFTSEVALTRGLSAALLAIAVWDDPIDNLVRVADARALLGEPDGSVWVALLATLQMLAAIAAGDLASGAEATEAVQRHRDVHPLYAAFADYGTALHEVVATGGAADAVDAMAAALDSIRRTHPHLLPLTQLQAAHVLADAGRADSARAFGLAGLHWPPTNTVIALMSELLRIRFDVLEGLTRPDDVDDVLARVERMEALGHVRHAGVVALRVASDLDRAGRPSDAAELRGWGIARLPDPRRRTPFEERLTRPGAARSSVSPPPPAPSDLRVLVLAPVIAVERGGRPVRLREMPARLLLGLLLAHPDPLHVERAIDLLWPEVSVEVGRGRLNTVVHRLRSALDLPPEALRRVGDVLLLDPRGWDVDLFEVRAACRPADVGPQPAAIEVRLAALRRVRGNLGHVQFPYDDHLTDHRRALAAELARTIREIERASPELVEELAAVRLALDPDGDADPDRQG